MNRRKRFPTKIIIICAAVIIGTGTGATLRMITNSQGSKKPAAKSIQFKVVQPQAPADDTSPEPVTDAPAAPASNETTTDPSTQTNAATAPGARPTYKFATDMAAAGITESDYGNVTDMVLDQNGWRLFQRDPNLPVWHLARQTLGDLPSQLEQVNRYVKVTYGGSWSAAHDAYVQTRNF